MPRNTARSPTAAGSQRVGNRRPATKRPATDRPATGEQRLATGEHAAPRCLPSSCSGSRRLSATPLPRTTASQRRRLTPPSQSGAAGRCLPRDGDDSDDDDDDEFEAGGGLGARAARGDHWVPKAQGALWRTLVTRMRVLGIPAIRLLSILAFCTVCTVWICSRLVIEPSSCQLERERAFRAEQMVYRLQSSQPQEGDQALQLRVAQLEQALQEERARSAGNGGFQGALVSSLKEENRIMQGKNMELTAQLYKIRGDNVAHQRSLLREGRSDAAPYERREAVMAPAPGNSEMAVAGSGSQQITAETLRMLASKGATAVAVMTCKRPKYLQRSMDSFTKQRGAMRANDFPFIISQDSFDPAMTQLVESNYVAQGVAFHMHHEHDPNAPHIAAKYGGNSMVGYVRIAQHFGWVMQKLFDEFGFGQVIFLEEDMEVSPDFFSYFGAMLPILREDPSMFCVSAWNDNGYATLAQDARAAFRTDFFPGLGWMMEKRVWGELRHRFAEAFWDEFMRRPDVRHGRHCIRPEISRSFTFGEVGTSGGQFFQSHLSKIRLNDELVDWSAQDLGFLKTSQTFEEHLSRELQQASPVSLSEVDFRAQKGSVLRIEYDDQREYQRVAAKFGLMPDEKEGIRRGSYRGVIPFSWNGARIYLYTRSWPTGLYR